MVLSNVNIFLNKGLGLSAVAESTGSGPLIRATFQSDASRSPVSKLAKTLLGEGCPS